MNPFKKFLFELQEMGNLVWRMLVGLRRGPRYFNETISQMDQVGVGSLGIIILTGFFTGGVLILQAYPTLAYYGAQAQAGQSVATTLVRELGPVLCALMVAGRVGSAISAEIGSMKVSQQIDAMRALGTDPIQKLVTPRLIAIAVVLPLLTIISDFIGLGGGYFIATTMLGLTFSEYWTSAWQVLEYNDLAQGLLKPFVFAIIIALVGCFYGMRTTGGTQGVGRATTRAVVTSSVWIFVLTAFITYVWNRAFAK